MNYNRKMKKEITTVIAESQALYWADDGFYTPEVGAWAETKYNLVHMYNQLFATGMKRIWDKRVYIDLFAGAGKARIRKTGKIVLASPMLALTIADKYDRYIFCEENKKEFEALQARVAKEYPQVDAYFLLGDCNKIVDQIKRLIPRHSKAQKVLSFCFIDPYALNIEFETIQELSSPYFVDFLILLAFAMDAKRNEAIYVDEKNQRINQFLGLPDWRSRWESVKKKGKDFRRFLAEEFAKQMINLQYREESLTTMIEMRSDDKNLPLYHLAFFSRHKKGYQFWNEVRKYATRQPSLF